MPDQDLPYLRAGVTALADYLQSDALFWPLPDASLPRLTLSGLLLSARRAAARMDAAGRGEIVQLTQALDEIRRQHRVRWEEKASRELETRLRMWRNFLDDYRGNPAEYAPSYPYEVRLRVMIALLQEALPPIVHVDEAVRGLDALLRAVFQPGDFVWEAELQTAFPPEPFWYLYGRLKT